MIALLALFRANFNYIDDMGRVISGRQFDFSRYTSDFLSTLIHDGKYLTDISPFTQILAAVFLSIASTLAIYLLTRSQAKTKFNFWFIVAALPIGLSPYFAENLSYKFDAPYMALSILCGIFPLVFYHPKRKNYGFMIASFLCVLVVCTTYQASTGIFPAMVLLMAFNLFQQKADNRVIIKFVLFAALSYVAGILFFRFFIMQSYDGYVDFGLFSLPDFIPGVISNYKHYLVLIRDDFRRRWFIAMGVILLGFVITNIVRTKQRKIIAAVISLIVLLGVMMLSFGVYPLFQTPLFRARAMYGFFTNLALLAIVAVNHQHAYIAKFCAAYLSYAFIVFLMVYGNALNLQLQHANYRIELVANDLNEIYADKSKNITVDFDGSIAYAPGVAHLFPKYPVLEKLIPIVFADDDGSYWAARHFYEYRNLPGIIDSTYEVEFDKSTMKLVRQTRTHDIYQKGENVLVELK